MIPKGLKRDLAQKFRYTPLHSAAWRGHAEVTLLLLEKGAEVNSTGIDGGTPLIFAVGGGHLDVTKVLLEKGAKVDLPGGNGETPVHLAAARGHREIYKLLLVKGAKLQILKNRVDVLGTR